MLSKQTICHIARLKASTHLSTRDIGAAALCSHQSVLRYCHFIKLHKLSAAEMEQMSSTHLLRLFFPNYPYRQTDKIEPNYDDIHEKLMSERKQTIFNCWLNYISAVGKKAIGRTQFYEGYRRYRKAQKLSMKIEHRAGEIAFVDYAGTTVPIQSKSQHATANAQIFVGILGCSQKIFAYATPGQTTFDWIESQIAMLEAFGGAPEIIVPDNPKALVTSAKPKRKLVVNYENFGRYYNVSILPARIRAPQDKALAEQAVGFITQRILADMKTMKFFSLSEINAYLNVEVEKLNNLPFQKRNTTRNAEFEKLDKPKLSALPATPMTVVVDVFNVTVPSDYMVLIKEHFYSVPYEYAHKKVEIHLTRKHVIVIYDIQIIAKHERVTNEAGFTRIEAHMHPDHRYFDDKTVEFYKQWAGQFGAATQEVMSLQFVSSHQKSRNGNAACRKIQSFFVADKMSCGDFEKACQFALKYGYSSPSHIKQIISSKAYLEMPSAQVERLANHANVRGSDYYHVHHTGVIGNE